MPFKEEHRMQSRFVIAPRRQWRRLVAGLVIGATAVGAGVLAVGGPAGARGSGAADAKVEVAPAPAPAASSVKVELRRVLGGLDRPVAVVSANDGSGRLFVAERPGTVRVVERSGQLVRKPFINVTKQVGGVAPRPVAILGDGAREGRGLLGIAVHPSFKSNGLVYLSYTDKKGDLRVSRFKATVQPGVPSTTVDPATERVLLKVTRRAAAAGSARVKGKRAGGPRSADHNGGQLVFGPDKFLYIGVGDSGGIGDPGDSA
jgi:glucose/arabinose dehydrogenase